MTVGANKSDNDLLAAEQEAIRLRARLQQLESELASERARSESVERDAHVGYWHISLPGFKIFLSKGVYSILGAGLPKDSISGTQQIPWSDHGELDFRQNVAKAVETRSSFSYQKTTQRADGVKVVYRVYGEPEFDANGNPTAVSGTVQDVTDIVITEQERDSIQKLYRIMTEVSSDVVMVRDPNGNVEFVSAALSRILGWTSNDVGRNGVMSLIHPEDVDKIMEMRKRSTSDYPVTATYRIRRVDGKYVWFETTISLIQDEADPSRHHMVSVMRDISERKEQELVLRTALAAAENANRAKSTFLANMSHELRTPLNAIIGFAEVIGHQVFGPIGNVRYDEYVSLIHKSGQHLLELINDVLDMAKIEAGKLALHIENFDLADPIEECVRTMSERASSGGVRLTASVAGNCMPCSADRRAVRQIVLNLLSNAIKFTQPGGEVDISAECAEGRVHIVVRDNGIGIAPEDMEKLGRPFEQVCDDPKVAKGGTGLGLALVRALVEQHGGNMRIESPDREGTIVTLDIPQYSAAVKNAA